jgi:hypothetical protein
MAVITAPQRAAAQPLRIANFPCWQFLMVQVIGPNTVYLAEDADELKQISDSGNVLNDGIQINQASGLVPLWWLGELWVAGSVPNTQFILQTPGSKNSLAAGVGLPTGAGGGGVIA